MESEGVMQAVWRFNDLFTHNSSPYVTYVIKPSNFNEIANITYRIKASWAVFTGRAVAVKWKSFDPTPPATEERKV